MENTSTCEACKDQGFLIVTDSVRGSEIQRCDACMRFKTDAAAVTASLGAAHTPGPWEIWDAATELAFDSNTGQPLVVARHDGETVDIAAVSQDNGEWIANARLIAAAPDGLELAHAVIDEWHSQSSNFDKKEPRRVVLARALIAKAS